MFHSICPDVYVNPIDYFTPGCKTTGSSALFFTDLDLSTWQQNT